MARRARREALLIRMEVKDLCPLPCRRRGRSSGQPDPGGAHRGTAGKRQADGMCIPWLRSQTRDDATSFPYSAIGHRPPRTGGTERLRAMLGADALAVCTYVDSSTRRPMAAVISTAVPVATKGAGQALDATLSLKGITGVTFFIVFFFIFFHFLYGPCIL